MHGKSIIIIDDHQDFRKTLRMFIEKRFKDIRISESASGEEGVEMALREKPNVALIDIYLPQMDGIDTATKIKAALPECRIITMSMNKSNQKFVTQEIVAFVDKSELEDKLAGLLNKFLS
jgi:DNA-binding NarL/FixJ family response regulator